MQRMNTRVWRNSPDYMPGGNKAGWRLEELAVSARGRATMEAKRRAGLTITRSDKKEGKKRQSSQKVTGQCSRCKRRKWLCSKVSDSAELAAETGVLNIGLKLQKSARQNQISDSEDEKEWFPGSYCKAADKRTGERAGTTTGRHNGGHSEARRTGSAAVPLCTRDFDILI